MHAVELFELYWFAPQPGPVFDWVFGIFAGKAFALFALCFGVSFYIIMESAKRRSEAGNARFAWRLTLLLIMGLLHGLIYRGDILQILALFGFSLLLFDRIRSASVLLVIAIIILLQPPLIAHGLAALSGAGWANAAPLFWTDPSIAVMADGDFLAATRAQAWDGFLTKWQFMLQSGRCTQILGLFIIGLLLGRIGFFSQPERYAAPRRVIGLIALAVWAAIFFGRASLMPLLPATGLQPDMVQQTAGWWLTSMESLALMTFQVALFVELFTGPAERALRLLAPAGRMTLTLYVGQSLVFVPLLFGWGLDLHDDISQVTALIVGLIAFALQVALAHFWFRFFRYGPLEWVWRAATRRTLDIPFRRRATA